MKTLGELEVLENLSFKSGYRLKGAALDQAFKEHQFLQENRGPFKPLPPVNFEQFFLGLYKSIQEWRVYRRDHIDSTQPVLPSFIEHMGGEMMCRTVYGFNPSKYHDYCLMRVGYKDYKWVHACTDKVPAYCEV